MANGSFPAVLLLLAVSALFVPSTSADVTYNIRTGTVDASSVCTTGVLCLSQDDCSRNCSVEDFSPQAAFDGDPATRWSSSLLSTNASVGFSVNFTKPQKFSSMEILFGYSNPPHRWNMYYVPAGGFDLLPWFAVIDTGSCPCPMPPCLIDQGQFMALCLDSPEATASVTIQLDELNIPHASAVMLEFVSLGESTDNNQMFYSIAELNFAVFCPESESFSSATDYTECPAPNGLYRDLVHLLTSTGQLLWSQKGNTPENVAMWYLNSVEFDTSSLASPFDIGGGSRVTSNICDPLGNEYGWLFNLSSPRNATTPIPAGASLVNFMLGVPSSCADGLKQSRVELYWQQDDSSTLLSVYDLRGCGDCVNELLLKLLQISEGIRQAILQVPPFSVLVVVDEAQLDSIEELLEQYKIEADDWQSSLILSERIYGLDDISLLETEDSLNSTILLKLSMLNQLITETSKFDLQNDINKVHQRVGEVQQSLGEIQGVYMPDNLLLITDDLLANLTALLAELSFTLQELDAAVIHGNNSLQLILSRNYDQAVMMLNSITSLLDGVLLSLQNYSTESETHRMNLMTVESQLRMHQTSLERAADISRNVSMSTAAVDLIHNKTSDLILQFKMLLAEAEEHNATATLNTVKASVNVNSSQSQLDISQETTEAINSSINMLQFHVNTEIRQRVDGYSDDLSQFRPTDYPGVCDASSVMSQCMAGELHARDLDRNSSTIVASSATTIIVAEEFLAQNHPPDIALQEISDAASEAITIGDDALNMLKSSNVLQLYSEANNSLSQAREIEQEAEKQLSTSAAALDDATDELNRSSHLLSRYNLINLTFNKVNESITSLLPDQNYMGQAMNLSEKASFIIADLQGVAGRLDVVESRVPELQNKVSNISGLVNRTLASLDKTDDLINETRALIDDASSTAEEAAKNIMDLIDEIDDLITNIDSLIASVGRTHDSVKKINSPVSMHDDGSYIILQPPPSQLQSPNGSILIDSIEIDTWFDVSDIPFPALVFYAGPVSNDPEDDLSVDDYIAITIDRASMEMDSPRDVTLTWHIGESAGKLVHSVTISFMLQLYITRVGSQFEFLVGTTGGQGLGKTDDLRLLHSDVRNASLLFQVTPKTEYIIGGVPSDAFLALPETHQYSNSFQVEYSLLLVNGELWSLWDYSKRSGTDFLSSPLRGFNFNNAAAASLWVGEGTNVEDAQNYVLSFDGNGYLKPARFVGEDTVTANKLTLTFRPVSVEGLILFLYEEITGSSLEVALHDEKISIMYNGMEDMIISKALSSVDYDNEESFDVEWGYRDGTTPVVFDTLTDTVLEDLELFPSGLLPKTTHAWMGGVDQSQLKYPFVPKLTNESFRGCLNMEIDNKNLFERSHITNNYFSSDSIIKGVSGTCFRTEAVLEVGFAEGHSTLSYSHIEPLEIPNERESVSITFPEGQFTLALSFLAQSPNGVLVGTAGAETATDIVIFLEESSLMITFIDSTDQLFELDGGAVSLGEWHDILLEISDNGIRTQRLYVDNYLVKSTNHDLAVPKHVYIPSSTPEVLVVGGPRSQPISRELEADIFIGCIRNIAFNMELMQFLTGALRMIHTEGIFYDSCPADVSSRSTETVLSVLSDPPKDTSCFQPPPAKLNDTLGGFHASTQLTTSNIFSLFSHEWQMGLDIRMAGSVGRVLTISSEAGVVITLDVEKDTMNTLALKWQLSTHGSQGDSSAMFDGFQVNTWITTEIGCILRDEILSCNVSAEDEKPKTVVVSHSDETFSPVLPMSFGMYNDINDGKVPSFTGCIRNVNVNDDSAGFDDLSTCSTCYENMEMGLGFTGISYISQTLTDGDQPDYTVSFSFRSERKEGLLLLLTTAANEQPLLGIGLFDGRVRATNFSTTGESHTYMVLSEESLCDSTLTNFTTLSVSVNQAGFSISLQYESRPPTSLDIAPGNGLPLGSVTVYVGGVPDTFQVLESTDPFSFLLSVGSKEGSLPPGMLGCVRGLTAHNSQGDTGELDLSMADEVVNVLEGICATV